VRCVTTTRTVNSTGRAVIEEFGIDTLILGSPEEETGITTRDYLTGLSEELSERFDLEILLLSRGEVVDEYRI